MQKFSILRIHAVVIKEFRQILRDKGTLALIIMMPLMLMLLFGYAINNNPRNLPTALVVNSQGELSRSLIKAMENTGYFRIKSVTRDLELASELMKRGNVQFVIYFPHDLERDLARGFAPKILIDIDATDPASSAQVSSALIAAFNEAISRDKFNPEHQNSEFELVVHTKYNPELLTRYQIIPGLIGILLTLTTILLAGISMTKEYERGTMENLLATPLYPTEVMLGKILPYLFISYLQICVLLFIARYLFELPVITNWGSLIACCTLLMLANLGVGFTFSTLAKNQLQVMQMTYFFFLPSLLLSGFMFPFYGMPRWAQILGEFFPLTHFLRMIRGIWLKNALITDYAYDVIAIFVFLCASTTLSLYRYKRTLD